MLVIGPWKLSSRVLLAPMAGITDRPFRKLCRRYGAGLTTSEMVSSKPELRTTEKTLSRLDHQGEPGPISVQIVGTDPAEMAEAARFNVDHGAQIIDINMGCPAKKVCNVLAGSALLRDEEKVAAILRETVSAVPVPVTLKIRTGWDVDNRNALTVAKIAEDSGIQALAIHGRTRACGFTGQVEYETIREVKQHISIPVIANGDITDAEKASEVLQYTGADAVMIGRAARSKPWIFKEINDHLNSASFSLSAPAISQQEIKQSILELLADMYQFYGDVQGVKIARKHLNAILRDLSPFGQWWREVCRIDSAAEQYQMTSVFLQDSF